MNHQTQLIFLGEILPGHDPVSVRARLAALLKLSPEQVERVFSGQRVVLHKGLPAAEVARYVVHLEQLGARVYAGPPMAPKLKPMAAEMAPAPAPPPAVSPATPAKPELALAEPLVDEMNCPKCNERQPKRTLCRSCSVDMKRFPDVAAKALPKHCWLKTDRYEAGMGADCPVPGQRCSDTPGADTKTVDHRGQSENRKGTECTPMQNIDEKCVDEKIRPGQPTGIWQPLNQCQNFVSGVMGQCRYGPNIGPKLAPPVQN